MQMSSIYLDYSATTPVDPKVVEVMLPFLTTHFGNPASRSHRFGWTAEEGVDNARKQVANTVGAHPKEIIWTSGATESNNLAIKGAAHFYRSKGNHIITCSTEHKAVLDVCRELERTGFEVTYLVPDSEGLLSAEQVAEAIRPETILVSVMFVNNEIGVVQPIQAIGDICRAKEIVFHVDAAQAVGKLKVNLAELPVDLMSFSAHKVYGPKGIGALFVRRKPRRIRLISQIQGGGHERGLRSGTLPVHQIVGMGAAFELSQQLFEEEQARIKKLQKKLLDGLQSIEESYVNGDLTQRVPHNLNISFNYVEGESLLMALKEIALSSGSACTSASLEPSYVLRALGRSDELAHSSLRFSIGRYTTEAEIQYTIDTLIHQIQRLRELSPLWEMYQDGIDLSSVKWAAH